jgi:hypothetical protein
MPIARWLKARGQIKPASFACFNAVVDLNMMKSSPGSAALSFPKVFGWGRIAALLLLSGFIFLPLRAEAGLPMVAVSIPTDHNLATGLRAAERCGVQGKLIVLPPLLFQLAGDESPASLFEEQTRAVRSMSGGSEVWLRVVVESGPLTGQETEKQISERVSAFLKLAPLSAPAVRGIMVEVKEPLTAPDLVTFGLIRLVVTAKASNADLRLAFVFHSGFVGQHGDIVKRLATYSDLLGTTYSQGWREDAAWIAKQALNKPLILKVDSEMSTATGPYLTAALAASGTSVEIIWSEPPDTKAAGRLCALNNFMARYITRNMYPGDSAASPLSITVDGVGSDEYRWFGGGELLNYVIVAHVSGSPDHPKTVSLQGLAPGQFDIQWYDPATGARLQASELIKAGESSVQTCACTSEHVLIYAHRQSDADKAVNIAVDVRGQADLTVEEIIARWQQYQESQRQRLDNYRSSVFMTLHFENTPIDSGFDISMQLQQFSSRDLMEWVQTELFVNGVKFGNDRAFPLPQLEPQKVMTQPLELRINEKYEYKLLGTEQVNGVYCYVIGVEPRIQGEMLYSGKVWIDGTTFRQVRQYLRQRGKSSNVISNVENQNFELVSDGNGNVFNLLKSITAQQVLNAAGRDFVLQKTFQFSGYVINSPDFGAALTLARKSDKPMFRDTETGLRALRKNGTERVLDVSPETRVRSIVGGTLYEGTFSFPIPIAGLSISDFNYRNTGEQLSVFFAGPILLADLSRQYGTGFRLGFDVALSALPGNNRIYSGNTELTQDAIWTWQEGTGIRATWQPMTGFSITASSYLSYEFYHGTSSLDPNYVLPRNGVTFLPGAELKYARQGYIFTATGSVGRRIGWQQFGDPAQPAPLHPTYTLYSADLKKSVYIKKFTKAGVDFGYYGGTQLDRFSRYIPSFFTTPRIPGVPGGTDSFDAMAIGSAYYGFKVRDSIKLQLEYSYARARNTDESLQFRKFDGLEFNSGTAGFKGTYVQSTISYALDGNIPRYNSRWGAYIMIFKPLR